MHPPPRAACSARRPRCDARAAPECAPQGDHKVYISGVTPQQHSPTTAFATPFARAMAVRTNHSATNARSHRLATSARRRGASVRAHGRITRARASRRNDRVLDKDGADDAVVDALALVRRVGDVANAVVSVVAKRQGLAGAIGALGPTYAKFGQALASRGDVVGETTASALGALQDDMPAFSDAEALKIVIEEFGDGAVAQAVRKAGAPVAAASLAQVYDAMLDGERVAIKVQRPNIREMVNADAALLRLGASAIEATGRVKAKAVDAVDEFCSRLYEEMDFRNEARNLVKFAELYGKGGSAAKSLPPPGVVVPRLIDKYGVGRRVIVMEWIDGEKLTAGKNRAVSTDDLKYVKLGIMCTLSQLIETGFMHADPHGGNLLKLADGGLAYLDFGLVSTVPQQVRDGLVAAIALLIFSRNYAAVGRLFGELMLIPPEVLQDEVEMRELESALESAAEATLKFPKDGGVPDVRFDQLLGALLALVPRFKFVLPPYFLNNARALGTLEGMAKSADPNFNILAVVYPYSMSRMLANPNASPVIRKVIREIATDDVTGKPSTRKLIDILNDVASLTGMSKIKIALDALAHAEGRALAASCVLQDIKNLFASIKSRLRRKSPQRTSASLALPIAPA